MERIGLGSCWARSIIAGLAALALVACSKEPITSSPRAKDGGPQPSYGPAVLHAQACPPTPAAAAAERPPLSRGCESCKPDEHCKVLSLRGENVGTCQKSTCEKDADCKGALCMCGPPNECRSGNCRGSEDCGGRECVANRGRYGHGSGMFCRTERDKCATHEDCGAGKECTYAGAWTCQPEVPPPPAG